MLRADPGWPPTTEAYRRPRRSRLLWWLAAPAVLVGVALVAVVMAAGGSTPHPSAAPAAAAPNAAPAPTPQPGPPLTATGDITWMQAATRGVELPVSRTAGPHAFDGPRGHGFAPTPLGAALAAAHIGSNSAETSGAKVYAATISAQFVPSPDTDAYRARVDGNYAQLRAADPGTLPGGPAGRGRVEFLGYRVGPLSRTEPVNVELLVAAPTPPGQPDTLEISATLLWDGQDWQMVPPPGGDPASMVTVLPSPVGFTMFPGR